MSKSIAGAESHSTFKNTERYIEFGPEKILVPKKFQQFYKRISDFEVRDDDVFILALPKTGSRWTQEMVWLLVNDLDLNKASELFQEIRSPHLEFETICEKDPFDAFKFDTILTAKSPRCIKSHLHWTLLPNAITTGAKQPKIIVCLRGPEDTCTSYYHHLTLLENHNETWNEFCKLFLEGKVLFGPYWKYVLSMWEQRHRPNVMFVKFNETKEDLPGTIRKLAKFLNKNLSDDEVVKMCSHLSFENLRKSKGFNMEHVINEMRVTVNPFIRKGIVGDYKNCMSSEVIEAFRKQKEEYTSGTDLTVD